MFTFGSDPEFFLADNKNIVSAIGIVPGTKNNKHKFNDNYYYYDNVLAECTIKPAKNRKEAILNIEHALNDYAKIVSPNKLRCIPSSAMDAKQLEHPHAIKMGCKREYCIYSMEMIEPDEEVFQKSNLRTAGGHIHIGADFLINGEAEDIKRNCVFLVRMLDLFIGIPSVVLEQSTEAKQRKEFYGQSGRCRFPQHGVEYRSPSNFWLERPALVSLIYDLCDFCVKFVEEQKFLSMWELNDYEDDICTAYDCNEMRYAIDKHDYVKSVSFLENIICDLLPKKLYDRIWQEHSVTHVDMYAEWGI